MCGGYELDADPEAIAQAFRVDQNQLPLALQSEHFPRMPGAIVLIQVPREGAPQRLLGPARWGLIPHWAEDASVGDKLYNARAETVGDKASFREAFARRRCVVPVTGFYEWRREGKRSQRFVIRPAQGKFLGLAGLWETWRTKAGEKVGSFTIITVPANALIAPIHDRMPVVLDPEGQDQWLQKGTDEAVLHALLVPCAPEALELRPG